MRPMYYLVAGLGAVGVFAVTLVAPVTAQREPVLKQITLPHHYYYREMYLPQVTSGPSGGGVAAGRQDPGVLHAGEPVAAADRRSVAEQLTTGPGYAYQPDAAPDGGRMVYSVYVDDAGRAAGAGPANADDDRPGPQRGGERRTALVSRRTGIAFVSTAYEGRFHVWLVDAPGREGGSQFPADPVRITPNVDSGLPRYYYARFDHYLHAGVVARRQRAPLVQQSRQDLGQRRNRGGWRPGPVPSSTPVHEEEIHLAHAARLVARRPARRLFAPTSAASGTSSGSPRRKVAMPFPLTLWRLRHRQRPLVARRAKRWPTSAMRPATPRSGSWTSRAVPGSGWRSCGGATGSAMGTLRRSAWPMPVTGQPRAGPGVRYRAGRPQLRPG